MYHKLGIKGQIPTTTKETEQIRGKKLITTDSKAGVPQKFLNNIPG